MATLAIQFPDFLLHHQIHQLQTGLTDELTNALTQPAHRLFAPSAGSPNVVRIGGA